MSNVNGIKTGNRRRWEFLSFFLNRVGPSEGTGGTDSIRPNSCGGSQGYYWVVRGYQRQYFYSVMLSPALVVGLITTTQSTNLVPLQ